MRKARTPAARADDARPASRIRQQAPSIAARPRFDFAGIPVLPSSVPATAPGDHAEREAERIAHRLTDGPHDLAPTTARHPLGFASVPSDAAGLLDGVGPGRPIGPAIRTPLEAILGVDLGTVRLHEGWAAAQSAASVGAAAYTLGRDIVLGERARSSDGALAHEIVHAVQQGGGGPLIHSRSGPALARIPTEEGIGKGRFSYSTNCGWIDWGHAIPDAAKQLISDVRRASATLNKEHDAMAKIGPPGEHVVDPAVPGKRLKDECPAGYDKGEIEAARVSMFTMKIAGPPGEPPLTVLGNFNVDSADASAYASEVASIAAKLKGNPDMRAELWGFTDCVGKEAHNTDLRARRALAAKDLFPPDLAGRFDTVSFAPMNNYMASNATSSGRSMNRSVVVRLKPPLDPVPVVAQQSSKVKKMGMSVTIHDAMLGVAILQPLTPDQELAVAMGIFQLVSEAFESLQLSTDVIATSSFSEEDLPSNALGFYAAARGFARPDIEKACDAWDATRSKAQLKGYTFGVERTHRATRLPKGGVWPALFSTITPEKPGKLWKPRFLQTISLGTVNNIVF